MKVFVSNEHVSLFCRRTINDVERKVLQNQLQVKDYVFNTAKGKVMKMTQGLYPAPLKILEVRSDPRQAAAVVFEIDIVKHFLCQCQPI